MLTKHLDDVFNFNYQKFYGTMSEIKTEVEYVIKTGRQLVEKKQVDFPRRVSQSLDALKNLYNKLGSQISQSRKNLERALKVSAIIASDLYNHSLTITALYLSTCRAENTGYSY